MFPATPCPASPQSANRLARVPPISKGRVYSYRGKNVSIPVFTLFFPDLSPFVSSRCFQWESAPALACIYRSDLLIASRLPLFLPFHLLSGRRQICFFFLISPSWKPVNGFALKSLMWRPCLWILWVCHFVFSLCVALPWFFVFWFGFVVVVVVLAFCASVNFVSHSRHCDFYFGGYLILVFNPSNWMGALLWDVIKLLENSLIILRFAFRLY